jgi:hypothetical protein
MVLRFLVEDVSMHLDEVLDAILRSLARRSPTRPSCLAASPLTNPVVT